MSEPIAPEKIEAVISVAVTDTPPLTLRENVANGNYRGNPVALDRSVTDGTHWIIYNGKTYTLDIMNIMVAVLDQDYMKDIRGKR